MKAVGMLGQYRCVDGAGGGAADDGKGIEATGRQKIPNRAQHPDLIGGASATAGEDQPAVAFDGVSLWNDGIGRVIRPGLNRQGVHE